VTNPMIVPCPTCGKPLNILAGLCTAKNGCGKLFWKDK
jgi:hypothetical protein